MNAVLAARPQRGQRLVYLYLDKPIGTLTNCSISIAGIQDIRGHAIAPTNRLIDTVLTDGARVFGQVRSADGRPMAHVRMALSVVIGSDAFHVSTIHTDGRGGFAFDYVTRLGRYFMLQAQHPDTLELATVRTRVRAPGQEILLFPTFLSKGTVRGRVLAAYGVTPVAGAPVFVLPSGFGSDLVGNADAFGEYVIDQVPVGPYAVRSFDGDLVAGQASGVISFPGEEAITDIQLVPYTVPPTPLVGRVFLSDATTPAEGFDVYVGNFEPVSGALSAIHAASTDATGSFRFDAIAPGLYDVVAADPASEQFAFLENVNIVPRVVNSVSIAMEALGRVSGLVLEARGIPVEGAVVTGGVGLETTGAAGTFFVEGVVPGKRRIEAGHPGTKRRGSTDVTVVGNRTVHAVIHLGRVSGTTVEVDDNGDRRPTAANVRMTPLTVQRRGGPGFSELKRLRTDPSTGAFAFDGIPLYDEQTLLETGIESGNYVLEAAASFAAEHVFHHGNLVTSERGIELAFLPPSETDGTISGTVFLPGGTEPAPPDTAVTIHTGGSGITVRTDDAGRFTNAFPLAANCYRLTAVDRMDSGFLDQEILEPLDQWGVLWICSGKMYSERKERVARQPPSHWQSYANERQQWSWVELLYGCKDWDWEHRSFYTRPVYEQGQQLLEFARPDNVILTNIDEAHPAIRRMPEPQRRQWLEGQWIIHLHHQRGADELPHRGLKDVGFQSLPFKGFMPNNAFYYCMLVSFFLYETFKEDVLHSVVPIRAYATTVRRLVIDIAAKLVRSGRQLIMKVSAATMSRLGLDRLWERCAYASPIHT